MRILLPLLLVVTVLSCSEPADVDPVATRIENASMSLALLSIPEGFELETNEAATLSLRAVGRRAEGRFWFEMGDEVDGSINLVDIVNGQRTSFEELPTGTFFGSRELQMGNGRAAYYSRGRFGDAGEEQEEFRISTLHPTQNRLMKVFYRYPAGDDSAERLQDLLLLLSEIEPLDPASAMPPDGGAE